MQQLHRLAADPREFLEGVRQRIREKLTEEISALDGVKFQLALKVPLRKQGAAGTEEFTDPVLHHKQKVLFQASEIKATLDEAISHLLELLEKWTQRGSGWVVDQVQTLWLDIARYQPLRGSSYIPLPAAVRSKKAVVNVKNKDDHCLRWALRSALFPACDHVDRPSKYPTEDGLNFKGIDAPTPISQIPKVEKLNNLAINVFGWDKGVTVNRLSTQPDGMPCINLLLIEKAGKHHFTWIKDLNRLLYDQSKYRGRKHFCERCLHGYTREDLLEAHRPNCRGIGQTAVRVEMPEEGKTRSPFRTTTSSCRPLSSFMRILRPSPPRLRDPSSTPQRAIPRERNTMRLAAIATSWCGVTARRSHQSNIAAPMQQSTSKNRCRKKRAKSRVC